MESWMESYIKGFLPVSITGRNSSTARNSSTDISVLSLFFIFLMWLSFAITYYISISRFIPSTRSLNFHPSVLLLIFWGAVSAWLYFYFEVNKLMLALLPGIIIGGGILLGLISFSFELEFPRIIYQANLAVFSTIFTSHALNAMGILEKYKSLDLKLMIFGSILMDIVVSFLAFRCFLLIYTNVPSHIRNPLGFDWTVISGSVIAIVLMSIISLFHIKIIKDLNAQNISRIEKVHLAATSLFIVFMLYLSFLMLLAVVNSKSKRKK